MPERIFEAGESGPARELSEEEKTENAIRASITESAKKGWIQKLLKATNTPLEQWVDEQTAKEMKRVNEAQKKAKEE